VLGLLASTAWADVKVVANTSGKGMGQAANGQSTTYVKGNKMRNEMQMGDNTIISITDLDAQKMFVLNPKKKEADVYDLAKMRADLEKSVGAADAKISFKPNGQTRTVLGQSCDGYDISIAIPSGAGSDMGPMTVVLSGPAWIAKNMDGFADYAGFFKTAAERGMFFSNPQQAKAQPAHAKGMAEMYRAIAETGFPLEQELSIKVEGSGPLAGMMAKMGNATISTTVTSIDAGSLSDDLFTVPPGYRVKPR